MPVIKSVETIFNGLKIITTDGEVIQILKTDLPQQVQNGTAQEIEDFCNNFLTNKLDNTKYSFNARVHVFQATPLVMIAIVANNGETIPPNWWQVSEK